MFIHVFQIGTDPRALDEATLHHYLDARTGSIEQQFEGAYQLSKTGHYRMIASLYFKNDNLGDNLNTALLSTQDEDNGRQWLSNRAGGLSSINNNSPENKIYIPEHIKAQGVGSSKVGDLLVVHQGETIKTYLIRTGGFEDIGLSRLHEDLFPDNQVMSLMESKLTGG